MRYLLVLFSVIGFIHASQHLLPSETLPHTMLLRPVVCVNHFQNTRNILCHYDCKLKKSFRAQLEQQTLQHLHTIPTPKRKRRLSFNFSSYANPIPGVSKNNALIKVFLLNSKNEFTPLPHDYVPTTETPRIIIMIKRVESKI